ncbi:DUF5916 domain-containing protein [Rheinheimera soli]|uniref:Carbohydrate family 9 binding domain-like n=1 Tax=Rheinheimera soli TaxID=443616 RepID=A0ABU1VZ09_9GAMM|nr:DUF5916 domain-containing protein [Rheinheimera soli]MDR7120950.1 hypothetical protein [Rheinheimera soli]
MTKFRLCMLVLGSLWFSAAQAAEIIIPKIPTVAEGGIVIDADLSEPAWQDATQVDIAYDTWPAENTPAPVKTTAYVMEDGEFFYISFIAEDPDPTQIRAFYRDRDKISDDDRVGIRLDTYNDSKLAYKFYINAFGVQADAIENEITRTESAAWDGIWHSAGMVTATGYQVEVAIPLRMLNFNDRLVSQTWKLELLRFYPRDVRHRLSSNKIERANPCWICQMSQATGFAGATQSNHFTLVPALVMGASQQRTVTSNTKEDWQTDNNLEPSLDVKWGITPNISLNATLNPDYSQVEADEAQVSVNDTFALFFTEKRAFFLDNADYFSSPMDLVYTRNLSSPDLGAKLTGRHEQQSFAFFAANDKSTTFIVPGNISSGIAFLDQKSENAVLRYRNDITPQLSLGGISTMRQSDYYHNFVYGLDMKYQWNDQNKLIAQVLHSDSQYPAELAAQLSGEAALRVSEKGVSDSAQYLDYQHENRNWSWYSAYLGMGENFRADMGYQPQTDFNKHMHGGSYQWFSDSLWWNRLRLRGDWDITHNSDSELLEKEAEMEIQLWGAAQSYSFLGLTQRDRVGSRLDGSVLRIDGNSQLFTERLFNIGAEIQPYPGLFLGFESEAGKKLDFRNNRIGDGFELSPELRWNIDAHFQVQARHIYRTLDADSVEVFTANLTDLRLSYQFSVRSFLRLALIYSDIKQNPWNNSGDVIVRSKTLGSQLLYSYKLNPQTLFFAGYSDNAFSDDDIQDLTPTERSIFMKFSYAWML